MRNLWANFKAVILGLACFLHKWKICLKNIFSFFHALEWGKLIHLIEKPNVVVMDLTYPESRASSSASFWGNMGINDWCMETSRAYWGNFSNSLGLYLACRALINRSNFMTFSCRAFSFTYWDMEENKSSPSGGERVCSWLLSRAEKKADAANLRLNCHRFLS